MPPVIDSRGNPTVETDVILDGSAWPRAVPSGASTVTRSPRASEDAEMDLAICCWAGDGFEPPLESFRFCQGLGRGVVFGGSAGQGQRGGKRSPSEDDVGFDGWDCARIDDWRACTLTILVE